MIKPFLHFLKNTVRAVRRFRIKKNSEFDGITYIGTDNNFHWHIERGMSQPYPRELALVTEYQKNFPNKNNTFIDVGAHIGTTSLPYARLFKTVVAFEPTVNNYKWLQENIALNNCQNIIAINKGVSDIEQKAESVRHGGNSGCHVLQTAESSNVSTIDVVTLDSQDIKGPVDFIKIDTEGSELLVLKGAIEILRKHHPLIQVETNDCSDRFFGYNKAEIFSFLEELGYEVLDDDGNDPLFYFPH